MSAARNESGTKPEPSIPEKPTETEKSLTATDVPANADASTSASAHVLSSADARANTDTPSESAPTATAPTTNTTPAPTTVPAIAPPAATSSQASGALGNALPAAAPVPPGTVVRRAPTLLPSNLKPVASNELNAPPAADVGPVRYERRKKGVEWQFFQAGGFWVQANGKKSNYRVAICKACKQKRGVETRLRGKLETMAMHLEKCESMAKEDLAAYKAAAAGMPRRTHGSKAKQIAPRPQEAPSPDMSVLTSLSVHSAMRQETVPGKRTRKRTGVEWNFFADGGEPWVQANGKRSFYRVANCIACSMRLGKKTRLRGKLDTMAVHLENCTALTEEERKAYRAAALASPRKSHKVKHKVEEKVIPVEDVRLFFNRHLNREQKKVLDDLISVVERRREQAG